MRFHTRRVMVNAPRLPRNNRLRYLTEREVEQFHVAIVEARKGPRRKIPLEQA